MIRPIALTITLTTGLLTEARAQQRPEDRPLSASEVRTIIISTADTIERLHFDSARGRTIAEAVRRAADDSSLASTRSALALVPKMNRLLQSIDRDSHLRFGYSFKDDTTAADRSPTPAELSQAKREAEEGGYGVRHVERLDGNIGYVGLTRFEEPEFAAEAIAAVMTLVHGTAALIIDLRGNGGGAPEMVQLLSSYFFPEPVLLGESYIRWKGVRRQWWSLPWVAGPRYAGDVFILTDRATHSAAEGFAYHLQQRKRVTVVGDTTKGGAHLTRFERVVPHFAVSVPVGTMTDAIGKGDWERTGVKPDVATDGPAALHAAHVLAIETVLRKALDATTRESAAAALTRAKAATAP